MAAKTRAAKAPPPAKDTVPTVEAATLATLFGLTPTRISQLGKQGTLPKAKERGKYLLWPSIKNYIAALKNPKLNGYSTADGTELPEGIRTRREKKLDLECEKIAHQIEVAKGKYTLAIDEEMAGMQFGMAVKQVIEALEDELPPHLEGLNALQMKVKIRDHGRSKLIDLQEFFPLE